MISTQRGEAFGFRDVAAKILSFVEGDSSLYIASSSLDRVPVNLISADVASGCYRSTPGSSGLVFTGIHVRITAPPIESWIGTLAGSRVQACDGHARPYGFG
ncbi:MAG TPA: hypothetical protein VGG18_02575 [Granulicella sp.]